MKSLNRVLLMGHVGHKPEIKFTPAGAKVASLSLATNEYWKDKKGEKQQRTCWHRIIFWSPLADVVENYVTRGAPLYVVGKLTKREYERYDEKRYVVEVVATDLILIGKVQEPLPLEQSSGSPRAEISEEVPF
jgi:single-strand DNA-binding protein